MMRNRVLVPAFLMGCTLGVILSGYCTASESPKGAYQIASLEAKVFHANTGRFSTSILTDPPTTLLNGVGTEGPFDGMLILVRVEGPAAQFTPELKVHVTAQAKVDTLLNDATFIRTVNKSGNYYVAFWLRPEPCTPLKISARLELPDNPGPWTSGNVILECTE